MRTIKDNIAVSIRGISKCFGSAVILDDINFAVAEGETIVLLGASGSGKTTILRIIAGLEMPDTGTVTLHGKDVTWLPARERGTGVIFQSYALFPKMTVARNIGYGLRLRGKPRSAISKRIDELISLVHLAEHRDKYPSQLSGGQQQRVAIARALAYKPEVLLFDEPFGALDAQIRTRLRREIKELLKEIGVPSIFITHDQEEALELGDRIAVLNVGRIEQIGTPFEIYTKPDTEYVAKFLGAANLLEGVVNADRFESDGISLQLDEETGFDDGQAVKAVFRPEDVFLRRPENLTRNYQLLTEGVVEEVSFVGAFERVGVRLAYHGGRSIVVTRPKTETAAFPLRVGQPVTAGVVKFRLIPNLTAASPSAGGIST